MKAYALLQASLKDKYPEAIKFLQMDEDSPFAFYDFPAAHWLHIRSTNVFESVLATERLRTGNTSGCGTRQATLAMAFDLMPEAQRTRRKLGSSRRLEQVQAGRRFVDRVLQEEAAAQGVFRKGTPSIYRT